MIRPPRLAGARFITIPAEVRVGALIAAALVLPVARTGSLLLAGLFVGLAVAGPRETVAVVLAVASAGIRWGTGTIDAVTGAQEVLGPAVTTGSAAAVAATVFAALAIIVSARRPADVPGAWLAALPAGVLAATIAAGGDPGADVLVRMLAAVLMTIVATGVLIVRGRIENAERFAGWIAIGFGLVSVAVALVSR